jgi:hypothetical protein
MATYRVWTASDDAIDGVYQDDMEWIDSHSAMGAASVALQRGAIVTLVERFDPVANDWVREIG